MKFKEGVTTKQKVEYLERFILVHSMIYYELDTNVISDKDFDKMARLLVKKIHKYGPKKIASTQYGYVFHDFDGTTGFDLIGRLNKADRERITQIALFVARKHIRVTKK